jgi:uncharacterized protein YhaN
VDTLLTETLSRLRDLAGDAGPPEWVATRMASLPAAWHDAGLLVAILTELESPEPLRGGEVADHLRPLTPADWAQWRNEAEAFETASRELESLQTQHAALAGGDTADPSRLETLGKRHRELAETCAPFTLDQTREEVAAAADAYAQLRKELDRAQTLQEKLEKEIPGLESALREAEEGVNRLRDSLRGLLRPAGGDPSVALKRLRAAGELRDAIDRAAQTEGKLLQSRNVESADELRAKLEEVRADNQRAASRAADLEEQHPLLRELAASDAGETQGEWQTLERRIADAEEATENLKDERDQLQRREVRAEVHESAIGNAAVLQIELRDLEREQAHLELERDATRIAFEALHEAATFFSRTHRDRLEARATEIFAHVSQRGGRSVRLGEQFQIQIVEPDGQTCGVRQLSQGARDQLALALRLAVADLLAEGARPPLLLDDPFLAFDTERLAAMRDNLARLAEEQQILLLSHREDLATWGTAVAIRR